MRSQCDLAQRSLRRHPANAIRAYSVCGPYEAGVDDTVPISGSGNVWFSDMKIHENDEYRCAMAVSVSLLGQTSAQAIEEGRQASHWAA
jgi:hypothetical protein